MAQIASITLVQTDEARPIIEAIMADNPGVRVLNMPGAVKLDCDGKITVKPRSTTALANFATSGVRPGISWRTITPGPDPRR